MTPFNSPLRSAACRRPVERIMNRIRTIIAVIFLMINDSNTCNCGRMHQSRTIKARVNPRQIQVDFFDRSIKLSMRPSFVQINHRLIWPNYTTIGCLISHRPIFSEVTFVTFLIVGKAIFIVNQNISKSPVLTINYCRRNSSHFYLQILYWFLCYGFFGFQALRKSAPTQFDMWFGILLVK